MVDGASRFRVNLQSPIAVYVQIENLVQFEVASGILKPGAQLPSVRELSQALEVNPNTVTKAYRDLELIGLVEMRRGVGVSVTEKAPRIARDRTLSMVRDHLREAVAECLACGMDSEHIASLVRDYVKTGVTPYDGRHLG